jgi:hypothetical protein
MQYSKLALLAAVMAPLASAQLSNLPSCALNPAISALGSTNCGTDVKCACSDQSFIDTLAPLIQKACTGAELQQAITAAQGLCLSVGVTLSIPGAPPATTAPAPPATTAPAPPVTTGAAPPVTTSAPPATGATGTTSSCTSSVVPTTYVAPNSTVVASSTPSGITLSNGAGAVGHALGFVAAAAVAVGCFAL